MIAIRFAERPEYLSRLDDLDSFFVRSYKAKQDDADGLVV